MNNYKLTIFLILLLELIGLNNIVGNGIGDYVRLRYVRYDKPHNLTAVPLKLNAQQVRIMMNKAILRYHLDNMKFEGTAKHENFIQLMKNNLTRDKLDKIAEELTVGLNAGADFLEVYFGEEDVNEEGDLPNFGKLFLFVTNRNSFCAVPGPTISINLMRGYGITEYTFLMYNSKEAIIFKGDEFEQYIKCGSAEPPKSLEEFQPVLESETWRLITIE